MAGSGSSGWFWFCKLSKKETLELVFSCEICEISKNAFFAEHLWTTASNLLFTTDALYFYSKSCIYDSTNCSHKTKWHILNLKEQYSMKWIDITINFMLCKSWILKRNLKWTHLETLLAYAALHKIIKNLGFYLFIKLATINWTWKYANQIHILYFWVFYEVEGN